MGLFNWFGSDEKVEEQTPIKQQVDFSNFTKITDFIYMKSGITDLDKRALTSSRVQQYAVSKNIYKTDDFLNEMKNNNEFYQEILNIVTVNETFFLRESKELEWLVEYIKKENRPLKILSMPSSSGEEVYSILLMLDKANIDISNINITGYDINSQAVWNAINGEYDEHSLHKIGMDERNKYFTKNSNDLYEISPFLKKQTSFLQQNIFEIRNENSKYDVVLSRNMFIYFDNEKRKIALDTIVNMLKLNGIYIKGHADHIYKHPKLKSVCYGVYVKNN